MNTPENILRTETFYTGEETIGGISCAVGYIKEFRWSWVATQLNTFIMAGNAHGRITRQTIEDFSQSCFEYALKHHKGWPRGIQSAVGSIAILQGNDIDESAIAFCEQLTKKHWSAFEIPVLYHTGGSYPVRFKKPSVWGAIYFPFFTKTIDHITGKTS